MAHMWKLLSEIKEIAWLQMQIGSDFHYPLDTQVSVVVWDILREYQKWVILCLNGDIFDTPEGQDSSQKVSQVISLIAKEVEKLIFVPGNHDLRWRNNPLESFNISWNVVFPSSFESPLIANIYGVKIIVANLLYDFAFVKALSQIPLYSFEEILKTYRTTLPDGTHLFWSDISTFEQIRDNLRKSIAKNRDAQILITHVLPHPSLLRFLWDDPRFWSEWSEVVSSISEIDRLRKQYPRDEFIKWWNHKSLAWMGANVFDSFSLPNAIYWHNHKGSRDEKKLVLGNEVRFITWPQPVLSK